MLPLEPAAQTVAVVGPLGVETEGLLSDYAGDDFCFDDGGYDCIETIAAAIASLNGDGDPGLTTIAKGVDVNSTDASGIPEALDLVSAADVAILVLGITRAEEHEGIDRTDLLLPGLQESFAQQVLALGKPTVLILANGGQLAIDSLVATGGGNITGPLPLAVIEVFNPNSDGSVAIAEALFATLRDGSGVTNRWGKLPYTMYNARYTDVQPMENFDMAASPGRTYKYYDGSAGAPLFPFGHGLSLTPLYLKCDDVPDVPNGDAGSFEVKCDVTNGGDQLPGDEVVMAFHSVSDAVRDDADHPVSFACKNSKAALRNGRQASLFISIDLNAINKPVGPLECCTHTSVRSDRIDTLIHGWTVKLLHVFSNQ